MLNAASVLGLCLQAHKSISFARVDGEFRCTTSSGSRTAPDLETLLRDLAWETHDALSFEAHKARVDADAKTKTRAALLDAITEDGIHAGDVPLPAVPAYASRETEQEALHQELSHYPELDPRLVP